MKIINPKSGKRTVVTDDTTNRSVAFDFEDLKEWCNNPVGNFHFSDRKPDGSIITVGMDGYRERK